MAAERRLHNPLSERNREQIFEFERKLMSEGLSTVRVEKYVEDTLLAAVSMPCKPKPDVSQPSIRHLLAAVSMP